MFLTQAAALRLPVHSKIKNFIRKKVDDGVFSVAEMKRHTEAYVKNELFCGKRMPSSLNRRYFPTNRDYSNVIYRSRMEKTHSVIDEENLIDKMHHWKISNPDDYFYFDTVRCPIKGPPLLLMTRMLTLRCKVPKLVYCLCISLLGKGNCCQNMAAYVYLTLRTRQQNTLSHYFFYVLKQTLTIVLQQCLLLNLKILPV